CDEVDGMLRRSALGVDGGRADLPGQARVEPRGAGDVVGLGARLGDAATDDLFDELSADAGAFDVSGLDGAQDLGSVQAREPSTPLADRGPCGLDDDWCAHFGLLSPTFFAK